MITVPSAILVTKPEEETVATLGSEVIQGFVFAGTPTPVSCSVVATSIGRPPETVTAVLL